MKTASLSIYNFLTMDDTKKMLRAIINGQSNFRQELLRKFDQFEKKLTGRVDELEEKIDGVEKRLTERLNKIGRQLAYLEDDTPTREEFDGLEERVDKLEQQPTSHFPS